MKPLARFVGWAATAAVLVIGVIDGAAGGPGLFLLPFGIVLLIILGRDRVWPDVLGTVSGVGALCLLVAYFNRDRGTCASGACPGVAPAPWLLSDALLLACSIAAYIVVRGRTTTV